MAAFDFNTTNPKEHKIQCEEALEKNKKTPICLNLISSFYYKPYLFIIKSFKKKSILKKVCSIHKNMMP